MQDHRSFQKSVTVKVRDLRRAIGANIHNLRLHRGLTLEKLSKRSGLTPDTIDRLEMGKGEIGLYHIMCLSVGLGIAPGILLPRPLNIPDGAVS